MSFDICHCPLLLGIALSNKVAGNGIWLLLRHGCRVCCVSLNQLAFSIDTGRPNNQCTHHLQLVMQTTNILCGLLHFNTLTPEVLISQEFCFFKYQYISALFKKMMNPVRDHWVSKLPILSFHQQLSLLSTVHTVLVYCLEIPPVGYLHIHE